MRNIVWLAFVVLAVVVAAVPFLAGAVTNDVTITVTISDNSRPFTPLHTYFMAPAGHDSCDGLGASTGTTNPCAWATPAHTVVCGDVIIAAAGTYNNGQFSQTYGTVNNCPSASGGIDGGGQIWAAVVLCGGVDLAACQISGTNGVQSFPPSQTGWTAGQSNWVVEGFTINSAAAQRTFEVRTCDGTLHHLGSINNVVYNSMQGFGNNDCGGPPGSFMDYIAVVMTILQNANQNGNFQDGICVGAADFVGLGNLNSTAGTHDIMYTNYGLANVTSACNNQYDGEAFYSDSPDVHNAHHQVVMANNIGVGSTRQCLAMTYSGGAETAGMIYRLWNNTCFHNMVTATGGEAWNGDINLNTGGDGAPWTVLLANNISYENQASNAAGIHLYAMDNWNTVNAVTNGAVSSNGQENVYKGSFGSCLSGACDPGFNIQFDHNGSLPPGTNFFVNPNFTNTTDLLANRMGVPNCAGFISTTACMGWNASTNTLTTPSVISDLVPTCGSNCTGKGFQLPSTTCVSTGFVATDYPTWLKGLTYLHWTGSAVVQMLDGATLPCGL